MRFLDNLFRRNRPARVEEKDSVWINRTAKFHGIRHALRRLPPDIVGVLLIAHFPDTLEILEQIAGDYEGPVPVRTALASRLSVGTEARDVAVEPARFEMIVGERHPLYSADRKLVSFADSLPCKVHLVFFQALDDPLTKYFVSDWVEGLLEKLGMNEDEPLESAMITRQIQAAQKKIESRSFGDLPAASAAEWLEKNLPDGWQQRAR